jgi:subtilisin family serine protease
LADRFVFWTAACALLLGAVQPAAAQEAAPTGTGVTIAVLDSGVDSAHPELAGRVERHSFSQPTLPPIPGGLPSPFDSQLDPDGQGTAVASRAAGATLGFAKAASVVDLQVSGHYTRGALDPGTEQATVEAMDWLLDNHGGDGQAGARIALVTVAARNLSAAAAQTLAAQAQRLWAAGVAVVVPAGNRTPLTDSPYVLTIGDDAATCSAAPLSSAALVKPDLSAPARNVKVAAPTSPTANAPTATRSGTEMGAAAVAGAMADAWQARSDLPVAALYAILRDTSKATLGSGGADGDPSCMGLRTLDVAGAVAAARSWSDPARPAAGTTSASPGLPLLAAAAVLLVGTGTQARRIRPS